MNISFIPYALSVAVSGGDDSAEFYIPVPADGSPYAVVSAVFLPDTAVTASNTNNWTVALKATDGEAGSPGSSMGGFNTTVATGASLAVGDKVAISVDASLAQIVAGGAIQIDVDEAGTAPAALSGTLMIGIQKRPPA
ncbi:MAG: hypothetical protein ACO3RX_00035 [Chthoniobacterales bacterium]